MSRPSKVAGRLVVMVCGDGGFMLGGITEFNTAVRERHDLITIVCNDGSYGAEHVQLRDRGMDPTVAQFDWPDLADIARSLGGEAVSVRSIDDLDLVTKAIH